MSKPLSYYAFYVNDRVDSNTLTTHNYVGVDNMIPNKGGVVDSEYVPNEGTSTAIKKGDILIGNIRPYFKKIWLATFDGGCSPDVLCIRSNGRMIPECLFATLSQDTFFKYNMAGSKGSKMPRGDKDHIMSFPIPELKNQDSIGVFITNLNKKIIINNKINVELESMAKTLYDYWFLQFEFPNEDGKPYKSSGGKMVQNEKLKREIPKGWKVQELLDLVKWESNSQPPKSEFIYNQEPGYIRFIQNRDYDSNNYITYIPFTKNLAVVDEFDILIDKYGDAGATRFGIAGAFNVALGKIHTLFPNTKEYIRSFLSCDSIYNFLHNSCMASTRASLSEKNLSHIHIAIPPDWLLEKYEKITHDLRKKILLNKKENNEISSVRDFLLPLLMNGQVAFKLETE